MKSYCSIESQFVQQPQHNNKNKHKNVTVIRQKYVFEDIENNEKAINQPLTLIQQEYIKILSLVSEWVH